MERIVRQVEKFGAELRYPEEVLDLKMDERVKVVATRSGRFHAFSIIIAPELRRRNSLFPERSSFLVEEYPTAPSVMRLSSEGR